MALIKNKLASELVVAGIALFAGWLIMFAAFGTPYPFYIVASGSMVPALEVNDILLVQGHETIDRVGVGDIIVFDRPDGEDRVIVHRIVEILSEEPRALKTRGDANAISIPGTDFPITEEYYIGKVVQVIPQIGIITKVLAPPINYILIAIIIGFMVYKHRRDSSASRRPADKDAGNLEDVPPDAEYSAQDEMGAPADPKTDGAGPEDRTPDEDGKTGGASGDPRRDPGGATSVS